MTDDISHFESMLAARIVLIHALLVFHHLMLQAMSYTQTTEAIVKNLFDVRGLCERARA